MMKSIRKGFTYVLVANLINMIFNLLLNFMLPYFLSVDDYAVIKSYQLYIGYAGLLHFGFVDGMYLKYGGKEFSTIEKKDFLISINTMRILEIVVVSSLLLYSLAIKANIFIFFVLSVLPLNMMSFYKQLYQATGEFSLYGMIVNASALLIFGADLMLILMHVYNAYYFLAANCLVYMAVWLFLEIQGHRLIGEIGNLFLISFATIKDNIIMGFPLTVGNLSSTLLTTMDRWFVKFLMQTNAFAQYSFAVSIEGFLNVAVAPFAITLYNYLCNEKQKNRIVLVRNSIMIFAAIIVSCAFPAAVIVEHFLIKYKESLNVLFVLFASQIFFIIVKAFYVNMYKARRMQNKYFLKLVSVIILGFFINIIFYSALGSMESFAIGTMITSVVWFLICIFDFRDIGHHIKEILYPFFEVVLLLLCGILIPPVLGILIYLLSTYVLTKILLGQELKRFFEIILETKK